MRTIRKLIRWVYYDTFGALAAANLLICTLSGIVIAVTYDVNAPYESISQMMVSNPAASFIRNMHYWSAQLFLILTIIHIIDHFYRRTEKRVKPGIWLRLVISVIATFFVMITGFILKGDADSLQARQIIDALIGDIPLIGDFLSFILLGTSDSLQLIYVHHIATATVFLFIVTYEHARYIWTKPKTTFITVLIISLLSYFFVAPLHDGLNPIVRGPWYFIGYQEILHWMSAPGWSLLFVAAVLAALYVIPRVSDYAGLLIKKGLLVLMGAYLVLTITGYFFRGENWAWTNPFAGENTSTLSYQPIKISGDTLIKNKPPQVLGRAEGCLVCHGEMKGFTNSHSPEAVGCASCHMGNPFTLNKDQAHKGMVLIPGNLDMASKSCGTANCHPDISQRIQTTLMTTNSGMVTVDRYVFNETNDLDALTHIDDLTHSAADEHFRNLCANCHLGNPKREWGPVDEMSRGGGCNACHLNHTAQGAKQLETYLADEQKELLEIHPQLSLNITNNHCFGCHSRSGRISTNYEGWHETQLESVPGEDQNKYRKLQDGRIFIKAQADVHHTLGMDCVDCHNSYEAMGDGTLYAHKEEQVKVACEDCHFETAPTTKSFTDLSSEEQKIIDLRTSLSDSAHYLTVKASGNALVNTFIRGDSTFMTTKNSGKTFPLSSPASICSRGNAHDEVSCTACHSSWAPQCIGCHNEFDKGAENAFDLLDYKDAHGSWVEYIGEYLNDPPSLGVVESENHREIFSFVPGMVMTIDKGSFPGEEEKMLHHRLFAPTSPHTTQKQGRDCKSCHASALALGYGRGELNYIIEGDRAHWEFVPRYANNQHDGLPEDAWTGFMEERNDQSATRTGMRPFTIKEQSKVLLVGSCLQCHDQDSELMMRSLEDFDRLLKTRSEKCILPEKY